MNTIAQAILLVGMEAISAYKYKGMSDEEKKKMFDENVTFYSIYFLIEIFLLIKILLS